MNTYDYEALYRAEVTKNDELRHAMAMLAQRVEDMEVLLANYEAKDKRLRARHAERQKKYREKSTEHEDKSQLNKKGANFGHMYKHQT